RVHGKVIDPAPMAFVSGHHGGDDSFIAGADLNPNEEELGVHLKLALDVFNWIVPGADEVAKIPNIDDCLFIAEAKRTDLQHGYKQLLNPRQQCTSTFHFENCSTTTELASETNSATISSVISRGTMPGSSLSSVNHRRVRRLH